MSLLLDALKRAEEAKRAKEPKEAAAQSGDLESASAPAATSDAATFFDAEESLASHNPISAPTSVPPASTDAGSGASRFQTLALEPDERDAYGKQPQSASPSTANSLPARAAAAMGVARGVSNRAADIRAAAGVAASSAKSSTAQRNALAAEELALASELAEGSPDVAGLPASNSVFSRGLPASEGLPSRDANAENRAVAQNVFDAKRTDAPRKSFWVLPALGVAISALVLGGWYVWTEINKSGRSNLAASNANQSKAATPAIASTVTGASVSQSAATAPPTTTPSLALPPLLPPALASAYEMTRAAPRIPPTPSPVNAQPKRMTASTPKRPTEVASVGNDGALAGTSAISITPSTTRPPEVSPALKSAYAALVAGDYSRAASAYRDVLAREPANLDAAIGLATSYARIGDSANALAWYQRSLTIDPSSAIAKNGMIALQGGTSAATNTVSAEASALASEGQLRSLIAREPNNAALHFSLANRLASERRWSEAQQSYFEAVRLDASNADFAYNLAVSLDHLNQTRIALDYYRRALALPNRGQFDRAVVEKRMTELSASTTPTQ
jgi:Tfp pilus assembly protein PilF